MKETSLSPPEQWILKGIPFLFLIGGLLHFAYQLLGQNVVVGLFAPVNESVWEHTKMLPLPMIAWWTVYYAVFGRAGAINADQWFTAALMALLTALLVMPMLFYFYTGAFGVELLWVDVLILLVALVAGQLLGLHVYRYGQHYLPAVKNGRAMETRKNYRITRWRSRQELRWRSPIYRKSHSGKAAVPFH